MAMDEIFNGTNVKQLRSVHLDDVHANQAKIDVSKAKTNVISYNYCCLSTLNRGYIMSDC